MPLNLFFADVPTPLGAMRLVWDVDFRVYAFEFEGYGELGTRLAKLHHSSAAEPHRLTPSTAPAAVTDRLEAFFEGELRALDEIKTETGGTSFQRKVWSALRRIPPGTTVSYGQLAARIGRPDASRAVGAANGSNPIAIIVPCHRIIGSGGYLTGYGGGIERKRWLLDHESGRLKLFSSP